eukprot:TRINITY_DN873_c0_g1_i4.p4 TRINITY_DN873_c0_g1~~TRINITY_DN873_c0_g1_i4.p4  ORF type:complete len:131 (+),score=28.38 TRINITY_DN873_c0_g1_i4:1141-1533(+)
MRPPISSALAQNIDVRQMEYNYDAKLVYGEAVNAVADDGRDESVYDDGAELDDIGPEPVGLEADMEGMGDDDFIYKGDGVDGNDDVSETMSVEGEETRDVIAPSGGGREDLKAGSSGGNRHTSDTVLSSA